ncbi:hypothetical protein MC81_31595 (plasmid) [Achromobacter insolitus]|nr:hypothetical protein MC81_31595 [Achromobacter insolitus]
MRWAWGGDSGGSRSVDQFEMQELEKLVFVQRARLVSAEHAAQKKVAKVSGDCPIASRRRKSNARWKSWEV